MAEDVVVVGAGGHAKVVIATLRAAGLSPMLVLDDDQTKWGSDLLGVLVRGGVHELARVDAKAVIGIGNNQLRRSIAERYAEANWASAVHPSAVVHESVRLGAGSVVFANAVVQPDVSVGRHVIVNTAATVDHDCVLEDFAQVGPGAHLGGNVTLRTDSFAGIGCSIHQGAVLGVGATLGGGAFLKGVVPDGATYAGVPARRIWSDGELLGLDEDLGSP